MLQSSILRSLLLISLLKINYFQEVNMLCYVLDHWMKLWYMFMRQHEDEKQEKRKGHFIAATAASGLHQPRFNSELAPAASLKCQAGNWAPEKLNCLQV